jgi:hypothetical protein
MLVEVTDDPSSCPEARVHADLLERYQEDDQEQQQREDHPDPRAPPPDRW